MEEFHRRPPFSGKSGCDFSSLPDLNESAAKRQMMENFLPACRGDRALPSALLSLVTCLKRLNSSAAAGRGEQRLPATGIQSAMLMPVSNFCRAVSNRVRRRILGPSTERRHAKQSCGLV
ncbi:MAG: hypothetical protein JNL84_04880 [Candidatus Accumulibacter sp.]|nr:hypothetical protein [Accumulibacter sp.]